MVPFERPTQQRKVPVDAGALPSGRHRLILGAGLAAVLIAAAVVRFVAARDEFWLDEIWSLLAFARTIKSPLDVFTLHHDNNHYLITLWMYFVGPQQRNWLIYRIPSLVAGIGTVALAAQVGRRWGTFATLAASIVTGASYVLIVYASEARGYALAGFFALVAFLALDRFLATRSSAANLLFVVACVLGFLSHLTFIEFYFGAALWSFAACRKSAPSGIDQQKAGRKSPSTRRPTSAQSGPRLAIAPRCAAQSGTIACSADLLPGGPVPARHPRHARRGWRCVRDARRAGKSRGAGRGRRRRKPAYPAGGARDRGIGRRGSRPRCATSPTCGYSSPRRSSLRLRYC